MAAATVEHIDYPSVIKGISDCVSLHPQCLWQEAHSWVQAINPPLNTSLSLWPHQHSRNPPTEWADPPFSPPCSQSNSRAASSALTTAYNGEHRISQPAGTPSPQPQPTLCCALCTHQPGCQQLHTWAQVSNPSLSFSIFVSSVSEKRLNHVVFPFHL